MRELERDPGLQLQRTALAWQRTSLATAGVALVTALAWARLGSGLALAASLVLAGVPAVVGRRRGLVRLDRERTVRAMLFLAVCAAALGLLGASAGVVGALQ